MMFCKVLVVGRLDRKLLAISLDDIVSVMADGNLAI